MGFEGRPESEDRDLAQASGRTALLLRAWQGALELMRDRPHLGQARFHHLVRALQLVLKFIAKAHGFT